MPESTSFDEYMRSRAKDFFGPDWDEFMTSALLLHPTQQQAGQSSAFPSHLLHSPQRQREPAIRVDISETDQVLIVRADLPGASKEDVRLNIDDSQKTLIIDANIRNPEFPNSNAQCQAQKTTEQSNKPPQCCNPACNASSTTERSSIQPSQLFPRSSQPEQPLQQANPQPQSQQQSQTQQQQNPYQSQARASANPTWKSQEFVHLNERRYGTLHRTIKLPKNCNTKNISTQLQDGVLVVCFQKTNEDEMKRQIQIE